MNIPPARLKLARDHLFSDLNTMREARLTSAQVAAVMRWRDAYAYWLSNPRASASDVVRHIRDLDEDIGTSTAYNDVAVVRHMIGALNESSRQFDQWRFVEMITETFEAARKAEDPRAMAAAAAAYGKYCRLDRDDIENLAARTAVQPFIPTGDPTVAGYKPLPDRAATVARYLKEFAAEVQDVGFEEVDFQASAQGLLPDKAEEPSPPGEAVPISESDIL